MSLVPYVWVRLASVLRRDLRPGLSATQNMTTRCSRNNTAAHTSWYLAGPLLAWLSTGPSTDVPFCGCWGCIPVIDTHQTSRRRPHPHGGGQNISLWTYLHPFLCRLLLLIVPCLHTHHIISHQHFKIELAQERQPPALELSHSNVIRPHSCNHFQSIITMKDPLCVKHCLTDVPGCCGNGPSSSRGTTCYMCSLHHIGRVSLVPWPYLYRRAWHCLMPHWRTEDGKQLEAVNTVPCLALVVGQEAIAM